MASPINSMALFVFFIVSNFLGQGKGIAKTIEENEKRIKETNETIVRMSEGIERANEKTTNKKTEDNDQGKAVNTLSAPAKSEAYTAKRPCLPHASHIHSYKSMRYGEDTGLLGNYLQLII